MNNRKRNLLFVFLVTLSIIIIPFVKSEVYMGSVDGYVFDAEGNNVSEVNVTATVSSCSNGCSGSYETGTNGYYVINNLNAGSGETISCSATKNNYVGTNSGVTNFGSFAEVNITLCPEPPTNLQTPSSSHNRTVQLNWTAGGEISSQTPYNEYRFNGGSWNNTGEIESQNQTVPQYNIAYTWQVRTCNSECCSATASDQVTITNTQPTQPSITNQNNTHNTSVSLCWQSGTDSDTNPADTLHDEFYFDNDSSPESNPIQSNTSITPTGSKCQEISNLTYGSTYYWRVKTCDGTGASNQCNNNTDSFTITNNVPSQPILGEKNCVTSDSVSLSWISGSDPENDSVHDEYQFGANGTYTNNLSNANSSQTETGISSCTEYNWRVRTCDEFSDCSNWSEDSFISCSETTEVIRNVTEITEVERCGTTFVGSKDRITTLLSPQEIEINEPFTISISYKSNKHTEKVNLNIDGPKSFEFLPATIENLDKNTEKEVKIKGLARTSTKLGEHTLTFDATNSNEELVGSKKFSINVVEKTGAVCGDGYCEILAENSKSCETDCHCGNGVCQKEFNENSVNCPKDCVTVSYTPFWFIATPLVILLTFFLVSKHYTGKETRLVKHIKARLKSGETVHEIYNHLYQNGWAHSTLKQAFSAAGVSTSPKKDADKK